MSRLNEKLAARLTDAQALRALAPRTRAMIKRRGFVRCLNHPNLWHNPVADSKGCALACVLAASVKP